MKLSVAALALVVVLAAWASWMFRHETNLHPTNAGVLISVFDRWDQTMTVCYVTKYNVETRDNGLGTKGCRSLAESEMAF